MSRPPKQSDQHIIPVERIAAQIYVIRGQSVMLDSDLAELYGVSTSRLNEQVKTRGGSLTISPFNARRFPDDFSFQLTAEEALMSQFAISKGGRGGRRKLPRVFSEQGVAMLSSVLRSDRAADVNVAIMRTFVRLRQVLSTNEELARKVAQHDQKIDILFEHIKGLLELPEPPKKPRIGFHVTDG